MLRSMNLRPFLPLAFAALALLPSCRNETPVQRAQRLCTEESKAKNKDATLGKLNDLVADTACQAGTAACNVAPDGSPCKDFIARYH
jgi:hypothetical protein